MEQFLAVSPGRKDILHHRKAAGVAPGTNDAGLGKRERETKLVEERNEWCDGVRGKKGVVCSQVCKTKKDAKAVDQFSLAPSVEAAIRHKRRIAYQSYFS